MVKAQATHQELAIVGIGCRFPGGADTPAKFWELLRSGTDAVTEVPPDRWDMESLYNPDYRAPGRIRQRHGGFVDHVREFDAAFFGISPNEAKRVDPQQRMLLEAAYHALEDAGLPAVALAGSATGVFVGISTHDYADLQTRSHEHQLASPYTNQGGALSIAANRISYVFDLRGPSVAVETACSSTLYALHVARLSLQNGDCDLAVVGGVNALLMPGAAMGFSRGMFLSASGRCQAFSAHADGYVRAEGAGVVVLKALTRARADGDRIYAVVRHTGVNEDGRTQGMALPSCEAQTALLEKVYRQAGVAVTDVGYVEAHGTGTIAGDGIEARALGTVLGRGRPVDRPCLLGSVKTNLGHLEAGSAAAGMIKLALCLHHREIPPSLHSETLNPNIPWSELRLEVARERRGWPEWNRPAVAGLSSYGFGGANAHAIFEAAPEVAPTPAAFAEGAILATLSARSEESLHALARRHLESLRGADASLADIAYSTIRHRDHHPVRAAVVARVRTQFESRLEALAAGRTAPGIVIGRAPTSPERVAFVCSGQGPQWWGMARQLFRGDRVFREAIEEVDALFRPLAPWRLIDEVFDRDEDTSRVDETLITQPALFALQISLARRLESLGILPAAVVGHSIGEVSAAVIAGALPLERGASLIYHRSRIQNEATGAGSMLAVGLAEAAAQQRIARFAGRISIAAVNRPELVALSGDADAIDAMASELEAENVFHRFIAVKVPFHSHHMDRLRDSLRCAVGHIPADQARLPLYSTVTGRRVQGPELAGDYWFRNVREPVQFVGAVREMVGDGFRAFVELSPHPILSPGVEDVLREANAEGVVLPTLRRGADDAETLLGSVGALYTRGHAIAPPAPGRSVDLPVYPWDRETFWCETEEGRRDRLSARPHPLVRRRRSSLANQTRHVFELEFDARVDSWLADHRIQEQVVVPAAAFIEAALACGRDVFGDQAFLEEVSFERALFLPEGTDEIPPAVELEFDEDDGQFTISSRARHDEPTRHVRGLLRRPSQTSHAQLDSVIELQAASAAVALPDKLYPLLAERGLQFGAAFRSLRELRGRSLEGGRAETVARVALEETIPDGRFVVHPVLLDACFQSLCAVPFVVPGLGTRVYIPVATRRVRLHKTNARTLWALARVTDASARRVRADLWLVDDHFDIVAEVAGFEGQLLEGSDRGLNPDDHYYELKWVPTDRPDQKRNRRSGMVLAPAAAVENEIHTLEHLLTRNTSTAERERIDSQLHRLALTHVVRALGELGVVWEPGYRFAALLPGLQAERHHQRLFTRLIRAVQDAGLVAVHGDECEVLRRPDPLRIEDLEAELAADDATANDAALVGYAGRALAAVLRGEKDGVQVLFSPEVEAKLALFYRQNYHNQQAIRLLGAAFAAHVRNLPPDRTLRVLEVGAGTGSATEVILAALPTERTEYVFTDVSPAFFADAKTKFGRPGLRFAALDLEREPGEQGFEPHSFDVVIASDVLHATSDVRKTLHRIQSLLGDDGALLAIEITRAPLGLDLIFGLTEGWWSFTDVALRSEHPTLGAQEWRRILDDTGFTSVIAATYQDDRTAVSGQHVLIARRPAATARALDRDAVSFDAAGSIVIVGQGQLATALEDRLLSAGVWVETTDAARLARVTETAPTPIRAVIDLRAFTIAGRDLAGYELPDAHALTTAPQMALAAELGRMSLQPLPRLVLVTSGAVGLAGDRRVDVGQAPVWGVGRTIASEYQQLSVRLVDLPAEPRAADIHALVMESVTDCEDVDVAIRGERRFVLQGARVPSDSGRRRPAQPDEPFRLAIQQRALLDTLAFQPCDRAPLQPDAVEIAVRAAGLNFRDVMNAMGFLPRGLESPLGLECSGVIARLGSAVTDLQVGDEVIAFSSGSFARYVVAPRLAVIRKPVNLTHEDAAGVPVALGTAWYGLEEIAQLRAGERILIHSATGGVGHAAIQVAARRGAEIFATAGSAARRDYLRDLGIRHVFDSRSMRWVEEVRAATAGEGVDVILNSLAGDAVPRGLELLAPLGRFVEIGVTDVFENRRIGLGAFRNGASYFTVRLDVLLTKQPDVLQEKVLRPIAAGLEAGELRPLPSTIVPADEISQAFRSMAQSLHRGKIVVSFESKVDVPVVAPPEPMTFAGNRTYVVTGGARGFGFRLAEWLVERGASQLVLLSRGGTLEPEVAGKVDAWRARGITVRSAAVDVGDEAALAAELAAVRRSMPPLAGVIHAAMVLADAPIESMDEAKFAAVMNPKAGGALNLDRLTREDELTFFVMLSSVASIVGNPGQANYNAANAMLDAIAHRRRLEGRPATVLHLGAIADVGFVSRNEAIGRHTDRLGVTPTPPGVLLQLFERTLREGATQRVAALLHPARIVATVPSNAARFARLVDTVDAPASASGLRGELAQLSSAQRPARITSALLEAIGRITGAEVGKLPSDRRLSDLGLDSLMSAQLSSWLQAALGVNVPIMQLLKQPTIAELATELASRIGMPEGPREAAGNPLPDVVLQPVGYRSA